MEEGRNNFQNRLGAQRIDNDVFPDDNSRGTNGISTAAGALFSDPKNQMMATVASTVLRD